MNQLEGEFVLGTKSETPQEPEPESPPLLPKGSYNIDFDSIDLENFNPFGAKSKISTDTALPGQPSTQIQFSPKKASPKKLSPKKTSPKKASPKKPSPKKVEVEEELDDSFHDAVEEVSVNDGESIEVRKLPSEIC